MQIRYRLFDNPRENRLAQEHNLLDEFCSGSELVDYSFDKRKGGLPPTRYYIHYKVKSIIGVTESLAPVYGNEHTVKIEIPPQYPGGGMPKCYMTTPTYHPNIQHSGEFKGKICLNEKELGSWFTLDMLAERIGEMLQYKNYHAENTDPFPEDGKVAAWVREYAEPNNIVNKRKKKFVDDRALIPMPPEWIELLNAKRKKTLKVEVGRGSSSNTSINIPPKPPKKHLIVVKK